MPRESDPVTAEQPTEFSRRLAGIFLVALVARVAFLVLFDNSFGHEIETYSKINLMVAWLFAGGGYPDTNFGPLHTWLLRLVTLPFDDLVLPARTLSLVCGVLLLIPFAHAVRLVFGSRVALVAAALLAVTPVHLRGSTTSLALSPYTLFLMCGLYYYLRADHGSGRGHWVLALSAVFLNLAGMLRFEAWLFLPPLCLLLARKDLSQAIRFGAMCMVFPGIHLYTCHTQNGDWVSFATTSAGAFSYLKDVPLTHKLFGWFVAFGRGMTVTTAVLAGLGLLYAAHKRKGALFAALFLFNYAIFQYKSLTNTSDPLMVRYTAGMTLMLLPFAAYVLTAAGDFIARKVGDSRVGIAPLLAAVMAQALFFSTVEGRQAALPDSVWQTALEIRELAGPDSVILAPVRYHPFFLVESRVPHDRFVMLQFTEHGSELDVDYLQKMLDETPPTLVVLDYHEPVNRQDVSNRHAFDIPPEATSAVSRGLRFERLAKHGDYHIFATSPERAPSR
jgi:hypothetical protein